MKTLHQHSCGVQGRTDCVFTRPVACCLSSDEAFHFRYACKQLDKWMTITNTASEAGETQQGLSSWKLAELEIENG